MERPIQIGDFVRLQIDDKYRDYQIKQITDDHKILLSMVYPNETDIIVTITFDKNDNSWKFTDVKENQKLTFILKEEYNQLIEYENKLLELPPEIITIIALELPNNDLTK